MARPTAKNNAVQYDSGSGGFLSVHTVASSFDCSGTNTSLEVVAYQRNADTEISGGTANSNSMTSVNSSVNSNVCGVRLFRYYINNNSVTVVLNTPTFKLLAATTRCIENVDQTTPIAQTVTGGTFSGTGTVTFSSNNAANKLVAAINTQNARTLTGSNLTIDESFDPADSNLGQAGIGDVDATGSSQTIGFTFTSDNWRVLGWEYNATSGTATNNARSAKITGKNTANANRSAKIIGKSTANNSRSSKIIGKNTSNDFRSAKIRGQSTANALRSAKLTGVNPLAETLQDNFNDDSIDSNKWPGVWGGIQIEETNQRLELTTTLSGGYFGIDSIRLDLTESFVQIKLVEAGDFGIPSYEAYPLVMILDASNSVLWNIFEGTLVARKHVGGVFTVLYSTTYDSNVHKYFRIREESGVVYWDTSVDGINWTNRASEDVSDLFDITNLYLQIMVGTWQAESSITTMAVDNVNILPVASNRNAKITGKSTANANRSAKVVGKNTANANRSSKIIGKDTANNFRAGKITGKDTANANRSAKIVGTANTNDNRSGKVTGKNTANANRNAKIIGKQLTNNSRNAIVVGKDTANNNRSAKIIGKNTASSSRSSKLIGTAIANANRSAKVAGKLNTNNFRAAKVRGNVPSVSSRGAKIIGSPEFTPQIMSIF